MVKTSPGFVKDGKGATVEDIQLIKKTRAGSPLGIKASAGIRDAENLVALVELARFAEGRTGISELRAHLARRFRLAGAA